MPQSHVNGWASDAPTPAQIKELFAQIESGRITKESLQKFLRDQGLNHLVLGTNVNYDRPIEDSVKLGRYNWADDEITSDHFPSNEKGKKAIEIFLIGLNRPVETGRIVYELNDRDMRPATIKELLALGSSHPRLQMEINVAALGSSLRLGNDDMIPCLMGGGDSRDLRLIVSKGDWMPFWRFAAVKIK